MHRGVLRVQLDRLAHVEDGLVGPALLHEEAADLVVVFPVVRAPVLGLSLEGLVQLFDRLVLLAFLRQIVRTIEVVAMGDRRHDDFAEAVVRGVDELGDVGGAVGRLGALDQDRRAVLAVGVDVREEQLGIRRVLLGRKHHPPPVRREAVPRIHERRVARHLARCAPREGHDPQAAVGAEQHAVSRLGPDEPFPVRRDLRERVAHPVARGPRYRFGGAAATLAKRHPVEVEADLGLVGISRNHGNGLGRIVRVDRRRAHEDELLPVGRPDRIAVDVARVVCARERGDRLRCDVVPREDAARGVEGLKDLVIREVADVQALVDGADDDFAAVGRDPREEPERHVPLRFPGKGVPRHDLRVVDHDLFADGCDRIGALVAVRAVDVHRERFSVGGEAVAVRAGRNVVHHDAAVVARQVFQPPLDQRLRRLVERLDDAVFRGRRHQGHVAVEDRRSDRVSRDRQTHARRNGRMGRVAFAPTDERHDDRARAGGLPDRRPGLFRGSPGQGGGLIRSRCVERVGDRNAARVDFAFRRRPGIDRSVERRRAACEGPLGSPAVGSRSAVVPKKRRRREVQWKDGAGQRVVDRRGRRPGPRGQHRQESGCRRGENPARSHCEFGKSPKRANSAILSNTSGGIPCSASLRKRARSVSAATASISNPWADAAKAARASGSTRSHRPAACEGSRITGRGVSVRIAWITLKSRTARA